MRKLITIAVASSALLLGGCTAATETAAGTTEPAAESVSEEDAQEAAFLTLAEEIYPGVPEQEHVTLAGDICSTIDTTGGDVGAVTADLARFFVESGTGDQEIENAGRFVGISIAYACPEYKSQLQNP